MSTISTPVLLGIVIVSAYIIQFFLGFKQVKHFNHVYADLRRLGRVAIGRRSGRFKAGTLVMFAIDQSGKILAAKKMQGVTVAARFKDMPAYIGQDIHYLDKYNPLVRQENKLLRIAVEDARDVFLKVEAGTYEEPQKAPLLHLPTLDQVKMQVKQTFKK